MKTIFILTHIPNPRMNKRIMIAAELGEVEVICVRRKSQNIWEPQFKEISHYIIESDMPSSRYLVRRLKHTMRFLVEGYNKLKEEEKDCLYVEGFEPLLLSYIYKKKFPQIKIFYEVADLREILIEAPKNIIEKFEKICLTKFEKKVLQVVERIIITSPLFFDVHLSKFVPKEKILFIPNIPEISAFEKYVKKGDGEFTVGFIGGIRYLKLMKMLVDASEISNIKVIFAGAGGTSKEYEEIYQYCQGKRQVKFLGRYNYSRDIAKLYGAVDCVYSVYDIKNYNVRIALPNKLYESIFCELPIIVAEETYLGKLVKEWGVGIAVQEDTSDLVNKLNQIKDKGLLYQSIVENCKERKVEIDLNKYNQMLRDALIGRNETKRKSNS